MPNKGRGVVPCGGVKNYRIEGSIRSEDHIRTINSSVPVREAFVRSIKFPSNATARTIIATKVMVAIIR